MSYHTIPYVFSPTAYASFEDFEILEADLPQGTATTFNLKALRRRQAWATTVPVGMFVNDLRADAIQRVSWEAHDDERRRLFKQMLLASETRSRPFLPRFDVIQRNGERYYHVEALRCFRNEVRHPQFMNALYRFLLELQKDPHLIVPKQPRRPYVPRDERVKRFHVTGAPHRGPAWTPDEDAVLRRWFGQRLYGDAKGKHVPLTEVQWTHVLDDELHGRRTKTSARSRMTVLNEKLFDRISRGKGYVSKEHNREYAAEVLGERPRAPRGRPPRRRPVL